MGNICHIFCALLTLVAGLGVPQGVLAGDCALPETSHCCESDITDDVSEQSGCCQSAELERSPATSSCCKSNKSDEDSTHDAEEGGCCSTGQCPCCSPTAIAFVSLQSDETLSMTVSSLDCTDDILSGRSDRPTSPPPQVQV